MGPASMIWPPLSLVQTISVVSHMPFSLRAAVMFAVPSSTHCTIERWISRSDPPAVPAIAASTRGSNRLIRARGCRQPRAPTGAPAAPIEPKVMGHGGVRWGKEARLRLETLCGPASPYL